MGSFIAGVTGFIVSIACFGYLAAGAGAFIKSVVAATSDKK